MHLEHVNLTVSDLDRSVAFYCRLLGISERWRGTTSDGTHAAHIGDDHSYLALFQSTSEGKAASPDYDGVGLNHVGFVVEDLEAALQILDAEGLAAHAEYDYQPGRRAYFFDHDQIEVELVTYTAAPA